jgi:hypothetical protein
MNNVLLYIAGQTQARKPLSIPTLQSLTGLDVPGVSRLVQANLTVTESVETDRTDYFREYQRRRYQAKKQAREQGGYAHV